MNNGIYNPRSVIAYAATRAEAKDRGLPVYYTGKPCGRGHITTRKVRSGNCTECERIKAKAKRDSLVSWAIKRSALEDQRALERELDPYGHLRV